MAFGRMPKRRDLFNLSWYVMLYDTRQTYRSFADPCDENFFDFFEITEY